MSILYIDTEHQRILEHPKFGPLQRAKREALQARLTTISGQPCHVLRYFDVAPAQVAQVTPRAIVIGGNMADWAWYDPSALDGLLEVIRAAPVPILGICGGHQLIGRAHRARCGPLGVLEDGEADPDPLFAPGQRKERGYLPVEIDGRCPIFRGLDATSTFFQSHYWQLETLPQGFIQRARSPWSSVQAIERLDRPVFGVQFHPERYNAAHPHGERVLRNFLALARDHIRRNRPMSVPTNPAR